MSKVKILDCTLRDGGYYNQWDFDYTVAQQLIASLTESGVDLIELGYKSTEHKKFYGLFKYCNEELLDFVKDYPQAEYAFMIDVKDFLLADGQIDLKGLEQVILPASQSIFSWVRIATHYPQFQYTPALVDYFQQQGYQVCLNLMGGSLISDEQLFKALSQLNPIKPEVFYIADSFGSFYPEDIRKRIGLIRKNFDGEIGVHLHDNQGMAYANALAAIEEGVDIVDATVCGMGRGAGNLLLEQFMLGYKEKYQIRAIEPHRLLPVINQYFLPLKEQYKWGFNYVYMLSGLNNIHQAYCQTLSGTGRYSIAQISSILESIPAEKKAGFKPQHLDAAVKQVVLEADKSKVDSQALPSLQVEPTEKVLIVAGGPSIKAHNRSLTYFLQYHSLELIECNDTREFSHIHDRKVVILNRPKLENYLLNNQGQHPAVITGETHLPEHIQYADRVYHQNFTLSSFQLSTDSVAIPDYDAGMFAIAVALRNGAEEVYLAGFDGFEDSTQNQQMEQFFNSVNEWAAQYNIKIAAVTPTRYQALSQSSVYALVP